MSAPLSAAPASFTRCELEAAARDCIPGSSNDPYTLTSPISISPEPGASGPVVFNWAVKNCSTAANQIRGQVVLVADNSKSQSSTDVNAARAVVLKNFLTEFQNKAAATRIDPNSADYPKISLLSYNGRSGTESANEREDDLNAKFTPDNCAKTTDFLAASFSSRWDDPRKFSLCEYLPFGTSFDNLRGFVDVGTASPRGSTDFTYFFKGAAKAYADVENTKSVGRNVVVVTDGLPNVPKYVAAASCRTKPRLAKEQIVSGERLGTVQEYCVDRQAVQEIARAHSEALTAPFADSVNVHHVLFTDTQTAYFDYDEAGSPTLNPAGFLIENSARTGNGKVKFSYAPGQSQLQTQMTGLFAALDKNALQYMRVEVTQQNGSKQSYNAVSPSQPGATFDIKFIGLSTGTNTVKVEAVYQDGRKETRTMTVDVGNSKDAAMKCTSVDDSKTVDGDTIGSKDPKGDGFYAQPQGGNYRDYRNADPGNKLAGEFGIVGEGTGLEQYARLRLQGGTGNCGMISGVTGDGQSRPWLLLLILLSIPMLCMPVLRRFIARSEKHRP